MPVNYLGLNQSVTNRSYYHLDHLNSTKWVTNETALIEVRYEYRAFGEQLKRLNENKEEVEDLATYSYGGKELDSENELYYFNARFYDASLGRFINVDPVQDGLNWYVYCSNNPINMVDPTGLENENDIFTITYMEGATEDFILSELKEKPDIWKSDGPGSIVFEDGSGIYEFIEKMPQIGDNFNLSTSHFYIPENGEMQIENKKTGESYNFYGETYGSFSNDNLNDYVESYNEFVEKYNALEAGEFNPPSRDVPVHEQKSLLEKISEKIDIILGNQDNPPRTETNHSGIRD